MKKLLLLLCTLLGTASAWAASYTVTYSTSTGSYTATNGAGTWASTWESTTTNPKVTFSVGANNIQVSTGNIYSGASGATYTITAQDGYLITGYTIVGTANTAAQTLTPAAGGSAVSFGTDQEYTLSVTGISLASTSFTQSTPNNGIAISSFTINLEDDPSYVDWTPSISDEAFVTVGEKVESISPITDASDNSKWYIITQVRGGESPMYNVGTGSTLKRTATSITPATISGTKANSCLQYLVRFIEVSSGLYQMQFANGDFITSSLTTSASQSNAGTYAFYNSNGGSGSYFGWNLNSNTGQRVDNNGPTYTVAFWDSGTVSGTSGNNVWYVYSTEVAVPSITYTYQISDASGVVFTSDSYPASAGDVISTLPSNLQFPYCSYVVTPTTIVNGENTVPVTVTYSLPFTVSTSFDDATWYYATIRGTKYLRADDNNKDGSGRYTTNSTNEKTDVYKWAFFGNPYGGFYIMNKGQGNGKYLYAGSQPAMQTVTDPTQDNSALWAVSVNGSGFSVRSITGANLYINDAGGAGNLGYWNSTAGATDGGSRWIVSEVPAATVDVTYELWVGGTKVNTVVDEQVAPNSEVAVPASLTAGYSTLAYDFVTSGTIGDSNCTITVTGTMKSGVITAISQLSNSKAYTLSTTRGSLGSNGTQMVSTNGTSYTASNFAIISYEDNFYLYSVADSKFVANTAQPALTEDLSTIAALVFDDANATETSPLFFMGMGSNGVNVAGGYGTGIVVNDWTTRDAGNQYCIIEAADFDATNALAALEEYFHPAAEAQFNDAIAALEAINFGTGLNQYGLTGEYAGYTSQLPTVISGLKNQGYSETNLSIAQALLANYALNMPSAGFYRIKGKTSSNYLAAGLASNNKFAMTDATDLTTIFYFDGTKLVNASSGLYNGVTASAWAWVDADGASTVEFQDGLTNGGYAIKTANAYFYDNGNNGSADRGGNMTITTSTNARYTNWYLEEASAFTLNLNDAGDGKYYATLCVPFDAILNGANAYTMAVDGNYLAPTEVATIAAGTPVLVKSENIGAVVTLSDNYAAAPSTETALTGTYVEKTIDGTTDYVLGKNADAVGFYHWDSNTLAANRAYVAAETGYSVKGFAINWAGDADGIKAIENANNNDVIYNLAGQRVTKAVRGIYVKNGKKVVVK